MGLGIPPLKFGIVFESNPLKSIMLVRRSAVKISKYLQMPLPTPAMVNLKGLCEETANV